MTVFRRTVTTLILVLSVGCVAGCYSTSSGTKIDDSKVSQIKKGVTTRAEVEVLLGKPSSVSMMGDGRRMMFYTYVEASGHATAGSYIPFANLVTSGTQSQVHTQRLQIILTKDDIVEDYEWSTGGQETASGMFHGKTTPTEK